MKHNAHDVVYCTTNKTILINLICGALFRNTAQNAKKFHMRPIVVTAGGLCNKIHQRVEANFYLALEFSAFNCALAVQLETDYCSKNNMKLFLYSWIHYTNNDCMLFNCNLSLMLIKYVPKYRNWSFAFKLFLPFASVALSSCTWSRRLWLLQWRVWEAMNT